jgi:hypothetical protein
MWVPVIWLNRIVGFLLGLIKDNLYALGPVILFLTT